MDVLADPQVDDVSVDPNAQIELTGGSSGWPGMTIEALRQFQTVNPLEELRLGLSESILSINYMQVNEFIIIHQKLQLGIWSK